LTCLYFGYILILLRCLAALLLFASLIRDHKAAAGTVRGPSGRLPPDGAASSFAPSDERDSNILIILAIEIPATTQPVGVQSMQSTPSPLSETPKTLETSRIAGGNACMDRDQPAALEASILAGIQRRVGQHRIGMAGMRQSDRSERTWEVLP